MPEGNKNATFQEIFEALRPARRILIVSHQRPDGDTLGSALALWHWLNALGKEVVVYCKNSVSDQFLFLSHANSFTSDPKIFTKTFDAIIICDSGDLKYAGVDVEISKMAIRPLLINIDHHASNVYFADLNIVDPQASSTAEMVDRFFEANNIPLTKEIASCLLTAVYTDTGGFTNAATNQRSLEMAARFVAAGASIGHVHQATMVNKDLKTMGLWGLVLSRLVQTPSKIVYTYLDQQDLGDEGISHDAMEGLANYLSQVQDARAVLVFLDRGDAMIKCSLRTIHDDIDLAAFAKMMGGGGHKKAAGFTAPGSLKDHDLIKQVVSALEFMIAA